MRRTASVRIPHVASPDKIIASQNQASTTLLLIGFLAFISVGVPVGVLNVAWEYIERTFSLTLDSLGLLLAAIMVGRLTAAFTNGRLIARFALGQVLLAGSLTAAAGLLGFALAPLWGVLLAAGFVVGLGSGMVDAGLNTYAAAHFSASRMNWMHACFGVGLTCGPIIVSAVVLDLGQSWRWSYLAAIGVELALVLCFLLTLNRWEHRAGVTTAPRERNAPMGETLRVPVVVLMMLLFFIYGGAEVGGGQLSNSLFTEGRGIDPKTTSLWISIYWGSFTIGRLLIGVLADRMGTRALLRMGLASAVVASLVLALNLNATLSFVALALMGFMLAPTFPTLVAETPRRIDGRHIPNAIGFYLAAGVSGGTVLPGVGGFLAERLGLEVIPVFLVAACAGTFMLFEWIVAHEARASRHLHDAP